MGFIINTLEQEWSSCMYIQELNLSTHVHSKLAYMSLHTDALIHYKTAFLTGCNCMLHSTIYIHQLVFT